MRTTSLLLAFALLASTGCFVSTRDVCAGDASTPEDCRPCTTDDECVFKGNPCEGVVFCAHREVELVSTSIGCEPEPTTPPDDQCVCRDSYCQGR